VTGAATTADANAASAVASGAAALAKVAAAQMSVILEMAATSATTVRDSLSLQHATVLQAEKEAAYHKGRSEILMAQSESQENRHKHDLASCQAQTLRNQQHELVSNQQLMNFALLQHSSGTLPPLESFSEHPATKSAPLTKDETSNVFLRLVICMIFTRASRRWA
jgi:hypothetical protein